MSTDDLRAHAFVFGRVQGVFFRVCTQREAVARGLRGWVRNRQDGSVELVVEGPADAVRALVTWAGTGPDMARVEGVDATYEAPVGLDGAFVVRPTL